MFSVKLSTNGKGCFHARDLLIEILRRKLRGQLVVGCHANSGGIPNVRIVLVGILLPWLSFNFRLCKKEVVYDTAKHGQESERSTNSKDAFPHLPTVN